MKIKHTLLTATFAATAISANAAVYVIDNIDLPTPVTTGAQSNYQMQSFTPNVAGIGTSDTVAANAPIPSTVYLSSFTVITTPAGSGSTLGQLFVDVYSGQGNLGSYIGSSSNSIDVAGSGFNTTITWTFPMLALDSSTNYSFVYSTDGIAGAPATARLTAANNGGGFVSTYAGGVADDNASGASPVPFDSRFQVALSTTIPEPTSVAFLGLAGLGLILRRKR